jgi:hypothetical protein
MMMIIKLRRGGLSGLTSSRCGHGSAKCISIKKQPTTTTISGGEREGGVGYLCYMKFMVANQSLLIMIFFSRRTEQSFSHSESPAAEVRPPGHSEQVVLPGPGEKNPAAQSMHLFVGGRKRGGSQKKNTYV